MSRCKIILFEKGEIKDEIEFSNSWGGAARIWTSLFDAYLKDPNIPFHNWFFESEKLWALAKNKSLPLFERIVHASTFDRAYINRKNLARFAVDLREFVEKYPVPERVDHLTDWAQIIEMADADAIGFHATTVSGNPWDTEDDGVRPLSEGFEVYEWIEGSENNEKKPLTSPTP